jgi:predicted component of type VI protein secretion system
MVPLVIQVEDLQTGASTKAAFGKSPIRIGRSELNDLVLSQGFVSQWHAQVEYDDARIEYVDLGSTNGSSLGPTPIQRKVPVEIDERAEIRIGSLRLSFSRRAAAAEPKAPPRTLFAVRAATAFAIPAVPAPAPAAPQPARPTGARAAPKPSSAVRAPGPIPAYPAVSQPVPAVAPPGAPAAPAAPASPVAPPAATPSPVRPAHQLPAPGPAVRLDLPTEFRMPAASPVPPQAAPPAAAAPPAPAAPSHAAGPALDLPTEFRMPAVQAPPPQPRPPGSAPVVRKFDAPAARPAGSAPSAVPPPPNAPLGGGLGEGFGAGPNEIERLLVTFAESYLPSSVSVAGFGETQAFLARLAEALEAFARGFVEMRKGYEEFGKQMGIRTVHGEGPVHRARDAAQLLAALLDPGQQGRAGDLQASFADYMVHHVALLGGVSDGAKAMLAGLSPEALESEAPKSLWPMKAQALWKTYEERFHELYDEEAAISDALFGREFGKAYARIIGRRGAVEPDDDEDEDDDDSEEGDRRGDSKKRSPPRRR